MEQIDNDTGPRPYMVHCTDDDDGRTWFLQFENHRPEYCPSRLSYAAMKWRISSLKDETGDLEEGDAFFVMDLAYVHRQFLAWQTTLPQVRPYYGNKSFLQYLHYVGADHSY